MLEDIVGFVVALLVPALEKAAITGMPRHIVFVSVSRGAGELFHELRNPLAFGHLGRNLPSSEMRGKPARANFLAEKRSLGWNGGTE
jgi:hypothetical protein